VVAVGECGLDFHYDRSPRDVQRDVFVRQLRLAKQIGKPVVVHTREADLETAEILKAELGPDGGVIHCFTSDWTAAQRYLALGMCLSFSGVLTFKNADAIRDAAARVPIDRILVETDCPFLAPVPHRGRRNEPAYVALTAARLAELRGLTLEELSLQTTGNARRALRLPA
jgi:TatD DNase family protein